MLKRRQFLAVAAITGISSLVACSAPSPTAAPPPAKPADTAKPAPTAAPAAKPTTAAAPPTPAAASPAAKAPAVSKVEPITVRLGWLHSGYYMPYFYAADRGFFRDQGLEPTINEGQGSVPVMQLVANGQDMFGNFDVSVGAVGLQNNLPIKMVATYFQIDPQALVVLEDSGIRTLKDMEGKSIGVIPGANTTLFLPQFLKQNGVDPAKVNLVNTDPANLIPAFLSRRIDVSTALINNQPMVFEAQGQKVRTFLFAEGGIKTLSVGIGVHTNLIRERGELIRRFLTATNQGWAAAMQNPEAGVDALMKLAPNLNRNILLGQFKATLPLLQTARAKGKPLGWTAKEDLDDMIAALVQVGALRAPVSVDALYTNEFIPS